MSKRNWLAINQLYDYHLRLAISLCSDEELLAGYQQGFPQLFMEGEDEGPLRVPLSALRETAALHAAQQIAGVDPVVASHFYLTWGWESYPSLRLPVLPVNFGDEVPIPDNFYHQLQMWEFRAARHITYLGVKYLTAFIDFDWEIVKMEPGGHSIISYETVPIGSICTMRLVRAEFIDLDA